jgi:hypothetical protein
LDSKKGLPFMNFFITSIIGELPDLNKVSKVLKVRRHDLNFQFLYDIIPNLGISSEVATKDRQLES